MCKRESEPRVMAGNHTIDEDKQLFLFHSKITSRKNLRLNNNEVEKVKYSAGCKKRNKKHINHKSVSDI